MNKEALITQLRGFYYAAGILENQQNDPLCGQCAAFARTAESITESFINFETAHASERKKLPEEYFLLFADIKDKIIVLQQPDEPVRQKKAGNCKLPQGVCFTKEVSAFLPRLNSP
ncbi:MAG: hypothetical protein HY099_03375 [Nitrospirae bacterium]|nr:hypothetical protein [Nitrospirota bacterium]